MAKILELACRCKAPRGVLSSLPCLLCFIWAFSILFPDGLLAQGASSKTDLYILANQRVKVNFDGVVLGVFPAYHGLCISSINEGEYKLYAKSEVTGELLLEKLSISGSSDEDLYLLAKFSLDAIDGGKDFSASSWRGNVKVMKIEEYLRSPEFDGSPSFVQAIEKEPGNVVLVDCPLKVELSTTGALETRIPFADEQEKTINGVPAGALKVYVRASETDQLSVFSLVFPSPGGYIAWLEPSYREEETSLNSPGERVLQRARALFLSGIDDCEATRFEELSSVIEALSWQEIYEQQYRGGEYGTPDSRRR